MNKVLLISAFIILTGIIIFTVAMTALKWNFTKLGTTSLETSTHIISDGFESISIKTNTADIVFLPSDNGECRVVCKEHENETHSASVQNGTLLIALNDKRSWYEHIGIIMENSKIMVYLPEKEYIELSVKASTSDITLPRDFKFKDIDITLSTGDVNSSACASGEVIINVSTGDIRLENVTADKIKVTSSTGDVRFKRIDASEIEIKTSTGDVKGTLLSEKVFIAKSSTGDVDVPETLSGGRCKITTSTGDINIEISKPNKH